MDREGGIFERLSFDPKHPEQLSRPMVKPENAWADNIRVICEDSSHCIWIETLSEGLTRYDPTPKKLPVIIWEMDFLIVQPIADMCLQTAISG